MNIIEMNAKIFALESRKSDLENMLKDYTRATQSSFSFTANWRDKASLLKKIPFIKKDIEVISKELTILKSQRDVEQKAIEYNKTIEAEKAKIQAKIDAEKEWYAIDSPISLLEV